MEEFRSRILENKDLFQRLYEVLEKAHRDNAKSRVAKSSYESPAWSEQQADANGYERALDLVLGYLQFSKD